MRERITVDKLYNFDELSESAQDAAIESIGTMNQEYFDPAELTYQFELALEEWGFPCDKNAIEWSLSYSQGDGVAFYGSINLKTYLTKTKQLTKFRPLLNNPDIYLEAFIGRNSYGSHYSHWNTMDVALDVSHDERELTPGEHALYELLQESLEENVVEVSQELERMGYAELEYISSREYIIEQIEINEWEFTADGKSA